jgi:crossover junction endodeoxyribonuclease RuvC
MTQTHRILGIDPGTRQVGYGVIEKCGNALQRIDGGCIRTKGDDLPQRLVQIHTALQEVISRNKPSVASIETVFAGENIRTAIAIGEARGVAMLSAAELGLIVVGYEPATVKRAVAGNGRAGKSQIQEMVRVLLGLTEAPETDHEADALALAITHCNRERFATHGSEGGTRMLKGRRRRKR